jgi:hypothetical protein
LTSGSAAQDTHHDQSVTAETRLAAFDLKAESRINALTVLQVDDFAAFGCPRIAGVALSTKPLSTPL